MYYPLYNNPFYYPQGAYMMNMCSCNHTLNNDNSNSENISTKAKEFNNRTTRDFFNTENNSDLFSINENSLEIFGISINIDDLIILIMLFFMFREKQVDYSIIIILALILFDQN